MVIFCARSAACAEGETGSEVGLFDPTRTYVVTLEPLELVGAFDVICGFDVVVEDCNPCVMRFNW